MRIAPRLLGILLLLQATQSSAKVAAQSLRTLAIEADVILVARITSAFRNDLDPDSPKFARATVIQVWKGSPKSTITFLASPTWTCDIADAKRGERVLLFLVGPGNGGSTYSIAFSGRGRMPLRNVSGALYATIWPDVLLPSSVKTISGPQPEYSFIVSAPLSSIKKEVLGFVARRAA